MRKLRKVRNGLFGLLALVLILLASISALVETEAGSHWVVKRIAALGNASLGAMSGNLRRGLDIEFVDYQQGEQHLRAEQLSFRWRPVDLLYSAVEIESFSAQKVVLQVPVAPPTEPTKGAFRDWPNLRLPVRIQVRDLDLNNIEYRQGDSVQRWNKLSGTIGLGTFHLRYKNIALVHDDYAVQLTGATSLGFPYDTRATVLWQWQAAVDASADKGALPLLYKGESELTGSLLQLQINNSISAPLVASLWVQGPLVTKQQEFDPAPVLDAHLQWQSQQLPAAWWLADKIAPHTSVDLKAQGNWLQYQAALTGRVQMQDAPALAVSVQAKGDTENILIDLLRISEQADSAATATPAAGDTLAAAELTLSGAVRWLPHLEWQLTAAANNFNFASVIDNWPSRLQASFTSRGRLQDDQWQIDLRQFSLDGELRGVNLNGAGELVFDGKQLHSDQLELTLGANQLQLKGTLGDALALQWNINAPMLHQLDDSLRGSFISSGDLRGARTLPRINASVSAEKFSWKNYAVDKLNLSFAPVIEPPSPPPTPTAEANPPTAASAEPAPLNALGILADDLVREQYQLKFSANQLRAAGNRFSTISVTGAGSIAEHQLQAMIKNVALGRADIQLTGAYNNAQWQGTLNQLAVKLKKVPRWWLTSSKPIKVGASYVQLGDQCLTTRTNLTSTVQRDASIEREEVLSEWQLNQSPAPINHAWLGGEKKLPASEIERYSLPQLCIGGAWSSSTGAVVNAQLDSVPLRQFLSLFKTEVYFAGVMDGTLKLTSKDFSLANTQAFTNITTRNAELRYQYAGGGTEVYAWRDFALRAQLEKAQLRARAGMEWVDYGRIDLNTLVDLQQQKITSGTLQAQFDNIAPLETLVPFANDVKGILNADLSAGGSFAAPYLLGAISLRNGSTNLPRLGLDLNNIEVQMNSSQAGNINLIGQLQSGDGRLSIVGDLNGFGSGQWNAQGFINGSDVKVINLPELKATLSPNLKVTANKETVNLSGDALIPWARANIKSLPPSATQVSDDVVIVDEKYWQDEPVAHINFYSNLNLALGDDVRFKGFGLSSKLSGKLNLLKEAQRQFFTNGYVSVAEGSYKAYGQTLTIDRGRLAFQGPYEDPGLDIRASRIIRGDQEIKVGLNIGGTLQRPKATVFSSPSSRSESESMMMLLTGKPIKDASKADASLLVSAMSGLGMDSGGSITAEINRFFGVDQLEVKADDGIDQSQLWIGKYLTPKLLVRYVVGIFDQAFSFGMEYQITNNLRIEAESGETKSVDVIYKIER